MQPVESKQSIHSKSERNNQPEVAEKSKLEKLISRLNAFEIGVPHLLRNKEFRPTTIPQMNLFAPDNPYENILNRINYVKNTILMPDVVEKIQLLALETAIDYIKTQYNLLTYCFIITRTIRTTRVVNVFNIPPPEDG